jgi:alkanesulfonate monooxygenase SsuD/methylene tetrahydromethanopterin reductase-like flavin-dependent oxidoreductase (luciferase family)
MKLGLMFVNSGPFSNPALLTHLATTAERCGIESMWTVEHVVIPQDYKSPYPYSSSGKIPGGEDVAMATLDVLSNGRAILGIGSGWLEEEFTSLGIDFHTRGARTNEAIKSLRALWSDTAASFHGKHFNFGPVKCYPKPVQKGGVPIHVGGHSPAAAKRAGRYGDGFFPALAEIPKLKELFAMMNSAAKEAGRDPSKIELSCMGRPRVDELKALADIGVSRVVIAPPAFDAEGLTRGLEKLQEDVIAKI